MSMRVSKGFAGKRILSGLCIMVLLASVSPMSVYAKDGAKITADTVLTETTNYPDGLTIAAGVSVTAPEGYEATLVVDGVEKNLTAGTYDGNASIVITQAHAVQFMFAEHNFRMGLYIKDGAVVNEKSVLQVLQDVDYDAATAQGGEIQVEGDKFNGILVGGNSQYLVKDVMFDYTGNGANDFAGYGAALMSTDTAVVQAQDVEIHTDGVLSVGVFANGTSNLTVKDSTIITKNAESTAGVQAPMMKEVPWLLGIYGNTRATNVLEAADVTYENCYVEAEAWGALSTDSCQEGASLTAINTEVVVKDSGYGSYADGGVFNTYTNTSFDVPDYGLIVAAGACGARFDGGSVVNSVRFGIMWHKNQEGTVTIADGSVFNTGETAFLIKSDLANTAYPNLVVDGAQVNTKSGVILHLMESDDPGINPNGGGPGSDTMWAPSYTVPVVTPVKDGNDTTNPAAATTADAIFKNMEVNGDIYNTRWTAGQNLNVAFENATVKGTISAATQAHKHVAAGELITPETRGELGEVTATPSPVVSNGMLVSLDSTSSWQVTGTSYLSSLTLAKGAKITAPNGRTLTMTVDGVTTPIAAGTYKGNVVLTVTKGQGMGLLDAQCMQILTEKTACPDLWVQFIQENQDDPVGKWLVELIKKLDK